MFTKALLEKVILFCVALSTLVPLAACSIGGESGMENTDNAPTLTQILEPTLTPTSSATPTETATPTPTLEPTPIVEGNIKDLTENMEEGDIIWSMFELQKIVNAYDPDSGVSFSEYIAQAKESISNEGNYERVYKILEKLEELGVLNSMSLIYALKDTYPEILFLDIPEGFDRLIDAIPENIIEQIIEYGKNLENGINTGVVPLLVYDGRVVLRTNININLESGGLYNGTIFMDGLNYEEGFPDFITTVIVLQQIEKDGIIFPAGVMLDQYSKIRLVVLSNDQDSKTFSGSYKIFMISTDALYEGLEPPEGEREP